MSYDGQISVMMSFDQAGWDEVAAWTVVTSSLVSCRWGRGKRRWWDEPTPQTATITLCDNAREFDPANTQSPHYPIVAGGKLQILFRPNSSADWQNRFRGNVTHIKTNFKDDALATVEFTASDVLALTNQDIGFPESVLADEFGDSLVWVDATQAMNADGLVRDAWKRGRPAWTSANELADGINVTNRETGTLGANRIGLNTHDAMYWPLESDVINQAKDGLFVTIAGQLPAGFEEVHVFTGGTFFSGIPGEEPINPLDPPPPPDPDAEEPSPDGTATTIDPEVEIKLVNTNGFVDLRVTWGAPSVTEGVESAAPTFAIPVGTAAIYTGAFILAVNLSREGSQVVVFDDAANQLAGAIAGSPFPVPTGNELKPGQQFGPKTGNHQQIRLERPTGAINIDHAAACYSPASEDTMTAFADALVRTGGFTPRQLEARALRILQNAGVPAFMMSLDFDSTGWWGARRLNGSNGLTLLQTVVRSLRGRVFVNKSGEIRIQGRDSCIAQAATVAATFSDDGSGIGFRMGSGDIEMPTNQFANTASVKNGVGVERVFIHDEANKNRVTRSAQLDFLGVEIFGWADSFFACEGDPVPFIPQIRIKPEADTGIIDALAALDIGDAVTVRRHPMGVGSVFSGKHVIEGEEWSFDSETGFTADLWLSPAQIWDRGPLT